MTAERPLGVLRDELRRAENALYEAFNELNSDPQFEIECSYYRPTGSRISVRRCQPAFVREAEREATQMAFDGITGASDPGILEFAANADSAIALTRRKMLEVMAETIESNPELMQLFLDYRRTQLELESALSE